MHLVIQLLLLNPFLVALVQGLEFYFHVDAAWGGYFATVLKEAITPLVKPEIDPFVPPLVMGPQTAECAPPS